MVEKEGTENKRDNEQGTFIVIVDFESWSSDLRSEKNFRNVFARICFREDTFVYLMSWVESRSGRIYLSTRIEFVVEDAMEWLVGLGLMLR